ncbi:MAG: MFS transporter [Phycisphaerae bacterium]|nr:MFS transporter [Phycisphaerae bacterium]
MIDQPRLYTWQFFQLFGIVVLYVTGMSLQYHFGKYTAELGWHEDVLGWIMGIGMAGSLLVRPWIGNWVDRLGTKPVLLAGTVLAGAAALSYRLTSDMSVLVILRIVATLANALFYTAMASHAAHLAPPHRRAEILGSVGIAGFVGIVIGPVLGDWIFSQRVVQVSPFTVFFVAAAVIHWMAAGLACTLRRPHLEPTRRTAHQPFLHTLRTCWPGMILLAGVTFFLSQTIVSLWIERFAKSQGIPNIRVFYLGYASIAIVLRIIGRRIPELAGRQRTLIIGFVLMSCGFLLLKGARTEFGLFFPALVLGTGHCFIYPSLIDLGAEKFPPAQRGLGTSIIMGAGDVGFLVGFITWGQLITWSGFGFSFVLMAVSMLLVAATYAWRERRVVFGGFARYQEELRIEN